MEERNEKEHKELIITANNGLKAIGTLQRKYADVTKAVDTTDNKEFGLEPESCYCSFDKIEEK